MGVCVCKIQVQRKMSKSWKSNLVMACTQTPLGHLLKGGGVP